MPQAAALTAAAASLPPGSALLKWDCINARQRNRAKRSLVVASSALSHVPNQAQTGATAATLAASVRGTPQRRTHRWREPDSNLRFRVKVTVSKPPSERPAKPPSGRPCRRSALRDFLLGAAYQLQQSGLVLMCNHWLPASPSAPSLTRQRAGSSGEASRRGTSCGPIAPCNPSQEARGEVFRYEHRTSDVIARAWFLCHHSFDCQSG